MILALIYLVKKLVKLDFKSTYYWSKWTQKVCLCEVGRASDLLIVTKFSTSRITWFKKLVIKQRFFVAILCQFKTNKITAKSWQEVNTYIGKGARLNSASSGFAPPLCLPRPEITFFLSDLDKSAEISKIFLSFICPNLM